MPSVGTSIAWRLRKMREHRGLTARELSRAAGLSGPHVSLIESGRRADVYVSTVASLAKALGVSFAWLAIGEGSPFDGGHSAFSSDILQRCAQASVHRWGRA